jgi:hypothetical protein
MPFLERSNQELEHEQDYHDEGGVQYGLLADTIIDPLKLDKALEDARHRTGVNPNGGENISPNWGETQLG